MTRESETPSRALRIFLCHSSGDKPAVRALYHRLRDEGVEPWLDEEDLVAGQLWEQEIPKAVTNSDIVIVCLSRTSITKSGYIQKEIKRALDVAEEQPEGTIYIIPLKLEEIEVDRIPQQLRSYHWVNFFEPEGYARLKHALQVRSRQIEANLGLDLHEVGQLEPARSGSDSPGREQITERFTRAIDQFGSQSLEIRLGGIYSLERIAREDRDYHGQIMEMLTRYVREHAFWEPEKRKKAEENDLLSYATRAPVAPEIQAILTVIGRRSSHHRDVESGPIDLNNVDLQQADLHDSDLQKVDLYRANLRVATLTRANLAEANLAGAHLRGANLYKANLEKANLYEADLQDAHLEDANLKGASLASANLQGAEPKFGADLTGAYLLLADLRGAFLIGAVPPPQEQLEWTLGDTNTALPDNLSRPQHWSKSIGEQREILEERLQEGELPPTHYS